MQAFCPVGGKGFLHTLGDTSLDEIGSWRIVITGSKISKFPGHRLGNPSLKPVVGRCLLSPIGGVGSEFPLPLAISMLTHRKNGDFGGRP